MSSREATWRAIRPDDIAGIVYTSGTTGEPKGVEWSHGALLDNLRGLYKLAPPSPAGDWPTVLKYADRYLAVNPLVIAPHRFLAKASAERGDTATAIRSNRIMLTLDPPDPTDVHYQLAKLLYATGSPEARRHVVMALEYAPRYQDALRLLQKIAETSPAPANSSAK